MKSHTQYPPSGTKNKDIGSSRRKRWCMMLIGNLIIGFAIGLYRLSRFGVDPFASLTLGLNFLTHISFGTCMAAAAAVFLAIQFLFDRKTIGAGTVLNMLVGYIADLTVWLSDSVLHLNYTMTVRIILLVAGTVLVSLGIAMYMDAKLGISPSNA
ncbi:MAG: YczE/YyaS/YitT family protein, partial [Eubacteriaceae bacterium]